jgi:hypothetical protein
LRTPKIVRRVNRAAGGVMIETGVAVAGRRLTNSFSMLSS